MKTCLTVTCILLTSFLSTINAAELSVSRQAYGKTSTGEKVAQYTLTNNNNITVKLITLGATLTSLTTPDRDGNLADIVLGYDDLQGYENDGIYSGCIVGRFANRISGASFTIGDQQYKLADNFANGHHLHGGEVGFNSKIWKATVLKLEKAVGVSFQLVSEDGDEGYPGKLTVRVNYTLNANNDLVINYFANTSRPTHINLTQHSYFNLAGHDSGDVHNHFVRLYCDHYLPVDDDGVPTGEVKEVAGTPFDFREGARISKQVDVGRYDHNYVLSMKRPEKPTLIARVSEGSTGRGMAVRTDQPGVQFYTSIHMKEVAGRNGAIYKTNQAFCLETQHFPDSPNKPHFPSTLLEPGTPFKSRTIHHFYTWTPKQK